MLDLRKADVSEILAIAGGVVKLAQLVGNSYGLAAYNTELSALAVFLFFASLLVWLRTTRKKLDRIDSMALQFDEFKREQTRLDHIARYGRGPVQLVRLLLAKQYVHGRAGGQTLSDVLLDVYGRAVEDLHRLTTSDRKGKVELVEYHVVDKFLVNLMKDLPPDSIWFGVTQLQSSDAWIKDRAEPSYYEFDELVKTRCRAGTIRYFRLWCFDSEQRAAEMRPIMQEQAAAGVQVRSCLGLKTPDVSLIWTPKDQGHRARRPETDLEALYPKLMAGEEYEPVCAIQFTARGGRELDAMTIYAPDADEFNDLRRRVKRAWDEAQSVAAAASA